MDNFTGDKVHFEPMSEPSEGPYKLGDFVSDGQFLSKLTTVADLHIARGAYAQGRQSMQAEVEALTYRLNSVISQRSSFFELKNKYYDQLARANQRWEKLKEMIQCDRRIDSEEDNCFTIMKFIEELESL